MTSSSWRYLTTEPWLRLHIRAYILVAIAALVANYQLGGGAWAFWPLYIWGLVLALHFFITKSLHVDEEWVRERTDDLKQRSYDLGHIHDIQRRIQSRDHSVNPPVDDDPNST